MAEQIRVAITSSDKSRNQIARESGVSKAQVSRLVNENREPRVGTAERIAGALGMELKLVKKGGRR